MNDAEFLLGEAVKLLRDVDDYLITDCIRLHDIELDPFYEGIVFNLRQFVKTHEQFGKDFEQWERIKGRRSLQDYLDFVKNRRKVK